MLTRLRALTPLVALALSIMLVVAPPVAGVAPYSLTISPSVTVSLGSTITMTLAVSEPVQGNVLQRGQTATIIATVTALSGPDNAATVYTSSPLNAPLTLQQTSPGVYTYNYLVSSSDPIGTWTIVVQASDNIGNS